MHRVILYYLLPLLLLSLTLPSPSEARPKAAKKQSAAARVAKKQVATTAKMAKTSASKRSARRAAIVEALKNEPKPKPSIYFPDEILLAEARGELSPLEEAALPMLGTRYRFGGNGEGNGIDCSAFVRKVYSLLNLPLPRTAREQFQIGKDIRPEEVRRGDLIFFQTYADYASHVGIYLGDDRMIHASSGGSKVMISNINTPYFRSRFLGARRIADAPELEDEAQQAEGLNFSRKGDILADLHAPF